MKYLPLYLLMIFTLFLAAGCEDLEEVTIYHEPYLNIFANVTAADPELNYVHVFRTTAYGEPDRYEIDSVLYHEFYFPSSGDTIRYETFYIDTSYAVNDAGVWFIRENDSIAFVEQSQGVYVPRDTNVQIESGSSYDLYVEADNFEPASASETALSPVSWDHGERIVISLSDASDSISWSDIGAAYRVIFRRHYRSAWYDHYYVFEENEVRNTFWKYDTARYDPVFNPDPFYRALHDSTWINDTTYTRIDSLELTASVVAYSASFLDYQELRQMDMLTGIIRYPAINDFRVNIDNALGAFTSISVSEERTVVFVR